MAGWQPIATAPRDVGRPILLYPRPQSDVLGSAYLSVFEGFWDGEQWQTAAGWFCFPKSWMHMPAPPLTIVQPRE
jgi:hypothetical protein